MRFEGRADVVSLFAENAGDDESALRFEDLGKFGREGDDYVRRQIGQNQVELLTLIGAEFVDFEFNLFRNAVDGGVFNRDFDGFGVNVEADDARSGPELDGRDGENACARSDVEHRPALPVFFEHLQTSARGLVRARAEGHSGVDLDHDAVSVTRLIASPRRAYEQALAYGDWLVALLPFGQPILIGDGQARNSAQREFGQVNQFQVAQDSLAELFGVRRRVKIGAQRNKVGIVRVLGDFDAGGVERPELCGGRRFADAGDFYFNRVPDFIAHNLCEGVKGEQNLHSFTPRPFIPSSFLNPQFIQRAGVVAPMLLHADKEMQTDV